MNPIYTTYVIYGQMFDGDEPGYITSHDNGRFLCTKHPFDAMYGDMNSAKELIKCINPYKATICKVEVTPIEEDE